MRITGNLLHQMSQRGFMLHTASEDASKALSFVRHIQGCPQAQEDAEHGLRRIIARTEAWLALWERSYNRAAPEEADRSDRLDDMKRRPFAYSAAQLVAERQVLGVSINWCLDRASKVEMAA